MDISTLNLSNKKPADSIDNLRVGFGTLFGCSIVHQIIK
jgi:hypothetical protein